MSARLHIPFLSLAAISFILGIIFAYYLNINFVILYVLALLILASLIFIKTQSVKNALIISAFFFVGALHQINFTTPQLDDIYYLAKTKLNKVSLKGVVASQIQESPFDKSFVFYPQNIKAGNFQSKVSGKVYVRFNKRIDLNYGDRLKIPGKLTVLKDKGYFNKRLIRQGIRCVLFVGRRDWITKEGQGGFSFRKLSFNVKENLKERFDNVVPPARDFLIAFILGDRSGLSKELYSVFKYTGTVHILAISGLHIGIVIFILLVFLKSLRIKQKPRFVITILFLFFYSFMTGLRPSVVRAVIMGTTFLLSFIVKREYHIYNSLALAAVIILGIWPWQIFDVGFQLSFISVLSIVFISPKILSLLPRLKNRFLYFVRASFAISLSAWLGATPLVAYYFGIVSVISAIANVFIVLLMPFIIAGGFIFLFMSFFIPILTKWLALSLEFIIGILIYLAICFKNIPFSYFYVERFAIFILFLYYALIIVFFNKHTYAFLSKRFHK